MSQRMPLRSEVLMKRWPSLHLQILPCLAPRDFTPSSNRRRYTQSQSQSQSQPLASQERDTSPPKENFPGNGSVERPLLVRRLETLQDAISKKRNSDAVSRIKSKAGERDTRTYPYADVAFQKLYRQVWGNEGSDGGDPINSSQHTHHDRVVSEETLSNDNISSHISTKDNHHEENIICAEDENYPENKIFRDIQKEIWGTTGPNNHKWLAQPRVIEEDVRWKIEIYHVKLVKEHKNLQNHLTRQSLKSMAGRETERQRRFRQDGKHGSSVWNTSLAILNLRANRRIHNEDRSLNTLDTRTPTISEWHDFFRNCSDPNAARAYWLAQPSDLAAMMWPELILSALTMDPLYALKLLLATHCSPYPPSYAMADCIQYILSHYFIYSKPITQERTAEIYDLVTALLIKRNENPTDPLILDQDSIFLLLSNINPNEIRNFYETLNKHKQRMNYSTLMQFACKFSEVEGKEMVMKVLEQMKSEGYAFEGQQISSVCTNILRTRFPLAGNEKAGEEFELLKLLLECGVQLNIIHYNVLIRNACKDKNHGLAWEIYDNLIAQGIVPNASTYDILMNDAKKRGDQIVIDEIWAEVQSMGIKNEYIITDYLHQIFLADVENGRALKNKLGSGSTFATMLEIYRKHFYLEPLAHIAPVYMDAWPHLPRPAQYTVTSQAGSNNAVPGSLNTGSTIDTSVTQLEPADQVVDQTREIPDDNSSVVQSTHKNILAERTEGMPSLASTPISYLMDPSHATLTVMLSALARDLPRPPYDPRPFHERPEATKPYTLRFYEHFHKLVLAGDPVVAGQLSDEPRIYNMAIACLGRSNTTLPYCTEVFRSMLNQKQTSENEGNSHQLVETSQSTVNKSQTAVRPVGTPPKPNIYSWSTLLKSFLHRNQLRAAEKVMQMMLARGVKPERFIWEMLVYNYSRVQDFTRAIDAVDRMEAAGFKPGTRIVRSLQLLKHREAIILAMSPEKKAKRWAKKGLVLEMKATEEEKLSKDSEFEDKGYRYLDLEDIKDAPTRQIPRIRKLKAREPTSPVKVVYRTVRVNQRLSPKQVHNALVATTKRNLKAEAQTKWLAEKKKSLDSMLTMSEESWPQGEGDHVEEETR